MPRRNRVDPFGDLHAVPDRRLVTGNRGCLVDDAEVVVRHHRGDLWITCVTAFRGRRVGLARPGRWTPLFFLDGAARLVVGERLRAFSFAGWGDPVPPPSGPLTVLTPPTSMTALRNGFRPELHPSAAAP